MDHAPVASLFRPDPMQWLEDEVLGQRLVVDQLNDRLTWAELLGCYRNLAGASGQSCEGVTPQVVGLG